jgi:carboxyl-terminal processing protease
MRARSLFGLIGVVFVLGGGLWLLGRARRPAAVEPREVGTKLFESVLSHVRTHAVDSLDDQDLYRRAAAGVIEELDDPYAVLLLPGQHEPPPEDVPAPQGVYLDRRDASLVILATVPGSPAEAAGVRTGDRLIAVDSEAVDVTHLDQVVRQLEGKPGTRVAFRIRRPGVRTPLVLEVVRGAIPASPALAAAVLPGGVARVRVMRFFPGLADSVRREIVALRSAGSRAIALDLRGTVGGDLADGAALADLFLGAGKIVVVSRARPATESHTFADSTASPFDSMPLAVLVNGGTAGAAEVVAGALQDHDRAAVLGSVTFGRGVTRSTFRLGGGASLRLTTALWLTPSGRQIQRPPAGAGGDSLPRPKLKSDAGRTLLGGGGIMPDRVMADTGSTDLVLEQARSILARASSARAVVALVGDQ